MTCLVSRLYEHGIMCLLECHLSFDKTLDFICKDWKKQIYAGILYMFKVSRQLTIKDFDVKHEIGFECRFSIVFCSSRSFQALKWKIISKETHHHHHVEKLLFRR